MSDFLDSLETEANSLRSMKEKKADRISSIKKIYDHDVNPRLKELYTFLKKVVDHLNFLDKETITSYDFPVLGKIENFKQEEYIVTVDDIDNLGRIELLFQCQRDLPITPLIKNKIEEVKLKDFLKEHFINFDSHTSYAPNGQPVGARFEIEPNIPIQFVFIVDMDTLNINLDIYNFAYLGHQKMTFRPNEINPKLHDQLGKFILRQDSSLTDLGMSEEQKQRIRENIAQAKKKSFIDKVRNTVYNPNKAR